MRFTLSIAVIASALFQFAASDATAADLAPVRINEFMAVNGDLNDDFGEKSDWIEIFNPSTNAVNLDGWYLTDATNNLTKWRFPATNIAANAYIMVWASSRDLAIPGAPLHTNFRLASDGEYLALVRPDLSIATEYTPSYPVQVQDVSYGLGRNASEVIVLRTNIAAKAFIPVNAALEAATLGDVRPWTEIGFNDSTWQTGTTGVGYDYPGYTGLDVKAMSNINETVYIRIPFVVADPTIFETMTLRLQYEDGFIAYLNGREVAWDNSPDPSMATWNSGAPIGRADTDAIIPRDFNISSLLSFLQTGTNVLAIQGLNNGIASSDLLIHPQLIGTTRTSGAQASRYFTTPTPGAANNAGILALGPIISEMTSAPKLPTDNDPIVVTARIRNTFNPLQKASLRYRVMFGSEVELPLRDDGLSGDGGSGDGIFGAVIPASASTNGQMVRWYIAASDTVSNLSRLPQYQDTNNSPQYFGTVINNPALTNPLEVLHWFIQSPAAAESDAGTRCSIFFLGEFYDNLYINLHGQSSRGFPKHSYDIDFNPGNNFLWQKGQPRVDDVNFLTTYPDKAHMRNHLSYGTYKRAGAPYHYVVSVRVQQNGVFWGDGNLVENGDENFLKRLGMDEQGALYKMYATFTDPSHTSGANAEKKTRKTENNADLTAFYNNLGLGGAALRTYLYDNVNIPEVINYLAARILTGDVDCCHKNYYFYRDTEGTGEWQMLPWDVDLSYGRVWNGTQTYWDQVLHPDTAGNFDTGNNNRLPIAIFGTADIRQMFLRRFRSLADDMLGVPGTLPENGYYEKQIDSLIPLIAPDADLDLVKWGTWGNGLASSTCCIQSLTQAADEIRNSYLPARRAFVYGRTIMPAAQPTNTTIQIAAVDYNPASSNQEEEYVQLRNTNNFSVDISGWHLSGGIDYTFGGGVVIATNGSLYVAANTKAFRARTTGPRGNQGLFVQGNYAGRLSARGENLVLQNTLGQVMSSTNFPPTPSPVQSFLRITEIMYHPPLPPLGSTNAQEDFEYIELKNIGPQPLNLNGVHFVNGVVFSFTGSSITNLEAGETVLVVKKRVAFEQRYGSSNRIAGEFSGGLENNGESIRLDDANNEKILEFSYNNSWYPVTDGLGFSLVIVNPSALFSTWGDKASWRPSGSEGGSPGNDDPAPVGVPVVLVNEALTHTDLPSVDTVELYNPGTNNVNIGGWYLTDDLFDPKKFRIPANTMILAGGYLVFDEHNFNTSPGQPGNFSLSSSGGDEIYLFSGNAGGQLTGYFHGFNYGAAENGVSFGRYVNSQGEEHFVAQSALTLLASNAPPKVGPVVVSEIMYHPRDLRSGVEIIENTQDEFIEIRNITGSPVPLFDSANHTNTWRLESAVEFAFPTNITLAANGVVLVVSFDPVNDLTALARFRAQFGIPTTVPIYGPFSGQLDNSTESVRLLRPDAPEGGSVPYILVDRVDYRDADAWPPAADGIGASLHRIDGSAYGNDPINWAAAGATPGTAYAGGALPVITSQPLSGSAVAFTDTSLSVTVQGVQPFTYQWRFGGTNIFGADSNVLVLHNLKATDAGLYSVIVFNPVGSVVSSNAQLNILIPAKILTHPVGASVRPGTNVTFTVDAVSNTPLHYQWRRNQNAIPGATSASYTLVNAQLDVNDGNYDVLVSDSVSTNLSSIATLIVLVNPVLTLQPKDTTVARGGTAVFYVTTTGTLPMGYRWRRGGTTVESQVINSHLSILVLTNVQDADAASYTVVITNAAFSAPGLLSMAARLTVVAPPTDTDGDGLPDQYEMDNGLNQADAGDANLDKDGDGVSNRNEYISGTNPQDATSYLKVEQISGTSDLTIRFIARANKTYSIEYTDTIPGGIWSKLSDVVPVTADGMVSVTDPAVPPNTVRYYRIVTPRRR